MCRRKVHIQLAGVLVCHVGCEREAVGDRMVFEQGL